MNESMPGGEQARDREWLPEDEPTAAAERAAEPRRTPVEGTGDAAGAEHTPVPAPGNAEDPGDAGGGEDAVAARDAVAGRDSEDAVDGAEPRGPEPATGPAPLGIPRTPTASAEVDAQLERLSDADHLPADGHIEVYEDVHRGLRDTLTVLDSRPGPPPPSGPRPPGPPGPSPSRPTPAPGPYDPRS